MRRRLNALLSLALGCVMLCMAFGQETAVAETVTVGAGPVDLSLGRRVSYFRDPSGTLTINEIRRLPASHFTPSARDTPNFSFTTDSIWLRFSVHWGEADQAGYSVWQQYPGTDFITFYRPDGKGGYEASRSGDQLLFAEREYPVRAFGFHVTPKPGVTETFYLQLQGAGAINVDLHLSDDQTAFSESETRHLWLGFYYGALLALLLYNLSLFLILRSRIYLFYSLYIGCLGVVFFCINGLAFRYWWPNDIHMNTIFLVFAYLSFIFQTEFSRRFLQTRRFIPSIDKAIQVALAILIAAFIVTPLMPVRYVFELSQYIGLIVMVLVQVISVVVWRKGFQPARYFVLASGFYTTGCIIYMIQNLGALPTTLWSNYAVQIGSFLEMVLYSFALADRINLIQREKADIEARAHQQLIEHSQTLESKVTERTQALLSSLNSLNEKHAALITTQEQLVHAEKMSSLGGLVAGVAHEINNPANFTRLAAENINRDIVRLKEFLHGLADDSSDEELLADLDQRFARIAQQLSLVHDGTERLSHIVSDLRRFSRTDESEAQEACPTEGLEATLNLVRAQYSDRIEIRLEKNDGDMYGLCYPAGLNQVFMNLAVNACQAVEMFAHKQERSGMLGYLHVRTERIERDGMPCWQAIFEDQGGGIPDHVLPHIFEPFFTTKDVGSGTGLGLSVSYGILQKHKGDIYVETTAGVGTTFIVTLPLQTAMHHTKNVLPVSGEDNGSV